MKTFFAAAVATVMMIGAAHAASPSTSASPATPPSAGAGASAGGAGASAIFTLAPDDATKLKTWITAQNTQSMPAPAGFSATVGATLPMQITLHQIPASAGVSSVGMNQYAVIDNKIVLVNPSDRRIVYVFA
jgi:hypothetical protein